MALLPESKPLRVLFFAQAGLCLRTAYGLLTSPSSASAWFFAGIGHTWAHFAMAGLVVATSFVGAATLLTRNPAWRRASACALGAFAAQTVLAAALRAARLDVARDAVVNSRTARGLPVSPEQLDAVASADAVWFSAAAVLAGLGYLAFRVWRVARHDPYLGVARASAA